MFSTNWINRWRHRHGFGVHSPAGYMLVRDVVYPKRRYRYYAEDRAEVSVADTGLREMMLLAIRLYGRLGARALEIRRENSLAKIFLKEKIVLKPLVLDEKRYPDSEMAFARIVFNVPYSDETGEALLLGPLSKDQIPYFAKKAVERFSGSLVIAGRRFVIAYRAPGLTSSIITV